MKSPEFGKVFIPNELVNLVGIFGADEGRSACIHHEKDDACGEDISLKTQIFSLFHFWWLIAFSSQTSIKHPVSFVALSQGRKTEVWNLQVIIFVKQDIFRFEISMWYATVVHIFNCINEHLDQASADFWSESTLFGNVFKQFSTFGKLKHNDGPHNFGLALHTNLSVDFRLHHINEMLEVKFGQELNLLFEGLFLRWSWEVDLDGVEFTFFATEVDTR